MHTFHALRRVLLVAVTFAVVRTAAADVKLPAVFSDHAVVQAEKPLTVWGWAKPGERVKVGLAGVSGEAVTAADGRWTIALPPLAAGGPHVMDVRGDNTLRVDDVLVGEVWFCSGQSNMAMQLRGLHGEVNDADKVIAEADYPTLRMFVHDEVYTLRSAETPPADPLTDRAGRWVVCTPKTAAKFTAMGYFFGRQLQAELGRPVGLMNVAVGGTTIEAWTSRPAQEAVPALKPLLDDWRAHWRDDVHFSVVQIPNYRPPQLQPNDDAGWAVWTREGQRQTVAATANASLSVTIDLGGPASADLHPKNKEAFARRSSQVVLRDVYKRPIALPTGPVLRSHQRSGKSIVLTFDFADGLTADGKLKGFAIADASQRFVWAEAAVEGDTVRVWNDTVADPAAVRYGWAANPVGNLRNAAGLPASPFRTDDWPASEERK